VEIAAFELAEQHRRLALPAPHCILLLQRFRLQQMVAVTADNVAFA
jgi:hypothetical protein